MTRSDLIRLFGNKEKADYAVDILLHNIKVPFLWTAIEVELKILEKEIEDLTAEGIINSCDGIMHVVWDPGNDVEKCGKAKSLLYQRDLTLGLLAVKED